MGAAALVAIPLVAAHIGSLGKYEVRAVYSNPGGTLREMAADQRSKEVYVLDDRNKRLEVFSPSGQLLRRIGGFGQTDRDLSKPLTMSHDSRNSLLYVIDGLRIKAFRPDGSSAAAFNVENLASSVAANGEGDVFLSSPRSHKLIMKYSSKGTNPVGFGELPAVTTAYPKRPAPADADAWTVPLGRTFLLPADDGGVFAVFAYAPLVKHFDRHGILLWSTPLTGPVVEEMEAIFWGDKGAPKPRATRNMDGKSLACFTISACRTADGMAIALGNRGVVFVNSKGQQTGALAAQFESPKLLDGITSLDGTIYLTSFNQLFVASAIR